jgi:hypothetical protein
LSLTLSPGADPEKIPRCRSRSGFDPEKIPRCYGGIFNRFYKWLFHWINFDTGGIFDRFYKWLFDWINFDTGGIFNRLYKRHKRYL